MGERQLSPVEPKTATLLLTLQRGGSDLVSTGNLNSTQAETVAYLREHGVNVIGGEPPTSSSRSPADPGSSCRRISRSCGAA